MLRSERHEQRLAIAAQLLAMLAAQASVLRARKYNIQSAVRAIEKSVENVRSITNGTRDSQAAASIDALERILMASLDTLDQILRPVPEVAKEFASLRRALSGLIGKEGD